MAKKDEAASKDAQASKSMAKFAAAHLPREGDPEVVERADKSLTVYLSARELERVEQMKTRLGLSRQDVMRQCIVSGLEQFNSIAKWWS